MPSVPWDRLLETCYRQGAEVAVLVPGSPPLVRVGEVFRALQVPPLTEQDLEDMVRQLPGGAPTLEGDGYLYLDFWYGKLAYYRAMAFGFPNTRALVLNRCRPPHPPEDANARIN